MWNCIQFLVKTISINTPSLYLSLYDILIDVQELPPDSWLAQFILHIILSDLVPAIGYRHPSQGQPDQLAVVDHV
ncbi:unnamed protein product [Nezara viridula]|uniref:Uncharacterized protein n=1 Tax=Nezara viridula TaxID=85310 RepID=A0A9P0E259_NEZVI|nr:unnamed protein product [Nezara viridula]